jgi:FeS assembly SUF system protein
MALSELEIQAVRSMAEEVLRTVRDPELPVNIVDMGLVYGIDVSPEGEVTVRMTLTTPMCPAAGILPGEVAGKVGAIDGVTAAKVDLVWDPPWTPQRMSEAARLEAGLM